MIFLLGARWSAIPMNNLSVSLWAALLEKIVRAGGRVMIDILGFLFIPLFTLPWVKIRILKVDEGESLHWAL